MAPLKPPPLQRGGTTRLVFHHHGRRGMIRRICHLPETCGTIRLIFRPPEMHDVTPQTYHPPGKEDCRRLTYRPLEKQGMIRQICPLLGRAGAMSAQMYPPPEKPGKLRLICPPQEDVNESPPTFRPPVEPGTHPRPISGIFRRPENDSTTRRICLRPAGKLATTRLRGLQETPAILQRRENRRG